jgi:predicted nucleic acid-binding protein
LSSVFIDTSFVVAVVNERDQHHARASELADLFDGVSLVTTDGVLLEIGNALARKFKQQAIGIIEDFRSSDDVEIVSLNAELFEQAFEIYRRHKDKAWGMVDCVCRSW